VRRSDQALQFGVIDRSRNGRRVQIKAHRPPKRQKSVRHDDHVRSQFGDACPSEAKQRIAANEHQTDLEQDHRHRAILEHMPRQWILFVQNTMVVGENGKRQVEAVKEPNPEYQANDPV